MYKSDEFDIREKLLRPKRYVPSPAYAYIATLNLNTTLQTNILQ
jgi:hypothetical protein